MDITIKPPTEYENAFEVTANNCLIGDTITIKNRSSGRCMAVHKVKSLKEHFWITGVKENAILSATVE